MIRDSKAKGHPVTCIVVEPIQSEGGRFLLHEIYRVSCSNPRRHIKQRTNMYRHMDKLRTPKMALEVGD